MTVDAGPAGHRFGDHLLGHELARLFEVGRGREHLGEFARELLVLAMSRYALRQGIELKINWAGRLGVAPTMAAPFFAMLGVHWLALILLYVGLALSLLATVLYVRSGLAQLRARKLSSSD